ncbi:MAG: hypothetical protein MPL62_13330, partial [Alphaproteobacteria bacterium]|nr:hypothetical protein [Alphaproteobacteria bacterium]
SGSHYAQSTIYYKPMLALVLLRIRALGVKRHAGLAGATPGEAAGIRIPAKNKWLSIIQNASRHYQTPQAATPSPT